MVCAYVREDNPRASVLFPQHILPFSEGVKWFYYRKKTIISQEANIFQGGGGSNFFQGGGGWVKCLFL